jgi:FSR family fosmidomycin resistance protein-like MFS transporter
LEDTETLPDVQKYSKRNLGLVAAAHAENHLQSSIYPYYYSVIMSSLGFGVAQLGLLVAGSNLIFGILQGIWGTVSKRYVDRKNILSVGNIFVGFFLSLSGLASNLATFASARIAGSISSSPQHPLALSMFTDQFVSKKRGTALAVHYSGGNVGTVLGPIIGFILLYLIGWQHALIVVGIPGVAIGILLWIFVKDNQKHGLSVDNKLTSSSRASYLSVLRNRNILTLLLGRMFTSGGRGLGVMIIFIPLYLNKDLLLPVGSFDYTALFVVLALGSVVAPILGGRVTDRMGRRKPMIVLSLFVSSVAIFFLILSRGYLFGVAVSLVVLGLFVFNEVPLSQALLSEIVTDANREGAYSIYFITDYSAGAAWSAAFGLIIAGFGYIPAFEVMIASLLLAGVILMFVREGKVSALGPAASAAIAPK